jgi:hypothetical protein
MNFPSQKVMRIDKGDDDGLSSWRSALSKVGLEIPEGSSNQRSHLLTQLQLFFKDILPITILIEPNYTDKDFRSLYYKHYSKVFREINRQSIRIHIFSGDIPEKDLKPPSRMKNLNYEGYFCISMLERPLLGRTVIKFHPKNQRDYICKTSFESRIFGCTHSVLGFPFIWQDQEVICCAHASLFIIHRYFSTRYSYYREALPNEILWSDDSPWKRLVPSTGLDVEQLGAILTKLGHHPEVLRNESKFDKDNKLPDKIIEEERSFFGQLHTYIESRIPIIACSLRLKHAVVILGRSAPSEYYKYEPRLFDISGFDKIKHFDASDFCPAYIVNDDNYFPYTIWNRKDHENESERTANDVDFIIIPLYEKIFLSAHLAKYFGLLAISSKEYGIIRMLNISTDANIKNIDPRDQPLVLRTLLTSSKSYLAHLALSLPEKASAQFLRSLNFPKFVWIVEIANKRSFLHTEHIEGLPDDLCGYKYGEIVLDATAGNDFNTAWLFIRLPGITGFNRLVLGNEFAELYQVPKENETFPEPLFLNNY